MSIDNDFDYFDKINVNRFKKKYFLFYPIFKFFCMHFWKSNGFFGKVKLWKCCKCGKNYSQDLAYDKPPINIGNCNE